MNKMGIVILSVLLVPAIVYGKEPVKPISVDTIQVLKIAAQDERAVIKTPDGKAQIIRVGDHIGERGKVIEISKDRVVIHETKDNNKEPETVIIRLKDGKQLKVERIKKVADEPQDKIVSSPATIGNKQ